MTDKLAVDGGTPVISTTIGAEGLQIMPEHDFILADDPETFAAQVIRLSADAELRAQLSRNGRQLVEQYYDWDRLASQFEAALIETAKSKHAKCVDHAKASR
jgi:polysaccharide biosynthesis protein PslH